jgi:hypothetical protein
MRKGLTVNQVIGFWMDKIMVNEDSVSPFAKERDNEDVFDAHATRTVCWLRVELDPVFSAETGQALKDYYTGTASLEATDVAIDYEEHLAVTLIESPIYPCYKPETSRVEPVEYKLTELTKELGFKHVQECKRFMEGQYSTVFGLGRDRGRWYLGEGVFAILQKNSRKTEQNDTKCVKVDVKTEGVNASEAA